MFQNKLRYRYSLKARSQRSDHWTGAGISRGIVMAARNNTVEVAMPGHDHTPDLAELADEINATQAIGSARMTPEQVVRLGSVLRQAKGLVAQGAWSAWVRENTPLTEKRAQRLMLRAKAGPEFHRHCERPVSPINSPCPTCGAVPGTDCQSSSGWMDHFHETRIRVAQPAVLLEPKRAGDTKRTLRRRGSPRRTAELGNVGGDDGR